MISGTDVSPITMTYYELLEIPEDADISEIKAAYRDLIKYYHPDTFEGDPYYAEEQTRLLNEAYETLIDPQLREDYDDYIGITGRSIVQEQIRRHGEEARARQDAEDEQKFLNAQRRQLEIILHGKQSQRMRLAAKEALVTAVLLLIVFIAYRITI